MVCSVLQNNVLKMKRCSSKKRCFLDQDESFAFLQRMRKLALVIISVAGTSKL